MIKFEDKVEKPMFKFGIFYARNVSIVHVFKMLVTCKGISVLFLPPIPRQIYKHDITE